MQRYNNLSVPPLRSYNLPDDSEYPCVDICGELVRDELLGVGEDVGEAAPEGVAEVHGVVAPVGRGAEETRGLHVLVAAAQQRVHVAHVGGAGDG